ncbi:MAG: EAL domain-containing protein (putative c-di-GMP-specific phosphodiesterase class I), partial [Myxococcota bacterium]
RLKPAGVKLAIDDFGTGASSLQWLHKLPASTLKIDRSFVARMAESGPCMVETVTRVAHGLGMSVIAEGVEQPTQVARLKALGCDYGQGYFFAPPLDCDAAETLIAAGGAWPSGSSNQKTDPRPGALS